MDVSELRKRILRALDDARREAGARRAEVDEAGRAWATFLEDVGVPLVRQAASVLRAEAQRFSVETPEASVRLVSDHAPGMFLEFELETAAGPPRVIGRVSVPRGRGTDVEEQVVAPGKPIADVSEDDVAAFLLSAIPKLAVKGR